jgi:hypothetical protein
METPHEERNQQHRTIRRRCATATSPRRTGNKTTTAKPGAPKGRKTARKAAARKPAKPAAKNGAQPREGSKRGIIIRLLKRKGGATLGEIMQTAKWQAHSVRGTISTVGTTMKIESTRDESGDRRYRIAK